MTATLTQLIGRVRSVVRDASGDFVTDADITQWLNEAITDLSARQELVEAEVTGTTSGFTLALPPSGTGEVLFVKSLMLGIDGDDVIFVDDDIWQTYHDSGAEPDYTMAKVFAETIELYPTPDTGTDYALRFSKIPAPLTSGSSTHALPLHMERKLTDYAAAYACYKMDDVGRGDRYMALYENGLLPVASGSETARPGPMTMVPIAGPFDIDFDAAHF